MDNNFFLQLFKTVREKEDIRAFEVYLKQHGLPGLIPLYNYLEKFHPQFEDKEKLAVSYIYERFYGQEISKEEDLAKRQRKQILNQMSALHRALTDFLIEQKLKNSSVLYDFLRLEVLKERQLDKFFFREAKKLQDKLERQSLVDLHLDLDKVKLYETMLTHPHFSDNSKKINLLIKWMKAMTDLFLGTGYMAGAALQSLHRWHPDTITEEVLYPIKCAEKDAPDLTLSPLVKALGLSYELEMQQSEDAYHALKRFILSEQGSTLTIYYRIELLTALLNFCTRRATRNASFYQEIFELNKYGLEERIFIDKGTLSESKFIKIVVTACILREFDWARNFIKEFQQYLLKRDRMAVVQISYGNIAFREEKPLSVLNILEKARFDNPFHEWRASIFCLMAKYDCGPTYDGDLLDECLHLKSSIKNTPDIKGSYEIGTINLITMIMALVRRKKTKEKLLEALSDFKVIMHKEWIKKKLASYRKI